MVAAALKSLKQALHTAMTVSAFLASDVGFERITYLWLFPVNGG
ncbi:hypothetical protein [Sphingopyxis sp. 113P3]|nr:hypothetical protein [Sphingopyxis sp. 113P3]